MPDGFEARPEQVPYFPESAQEGKLRDLLNRSIEFSEERQKNMKDYLAVAGGGNIPLVIAGPNINPQDTDRMYREIKRDNIYFKPEEKPIAVYDPAKGEVSMFLDGKRTQGWKGVDLGVGGEGLMDLRIEKNRMDHVETPDYEKISDTAEKPQGTTFLTGKMPSPEKQNEKPKDGNFLSGFLSGIVPEAQAGDYDPESKLIDETQNIKLRGVDEMPEAPKGSFPVSFQAGRPFIGIDWGAVNNIAGQGQAIKDFSDRLSDTFKERRKDENYAFSELNQGLKLRQEVKADLGQTDIIPQDIIKFWNVMNKQTKLPNKITMLVVDDYYKSTPKLPPRPETSPNYIIYYKKSNMMHAYVGSQNYLTSQCDEKALKKTCTRRAGADKN